MTTQDYFELATVMFLCSLGIPTIHLIMGMFDFKVYCVLVAFLFVAAITWPVSVPLIFIAVIVAAVLFVKALVKGEL